MAPPFGFPVLFLGGLELPTFFGVANELGGVQTLDGRLNVTEGCGPADFIDEHGGHIGFRAGQVTNEFQQTDGLGDPQCPTVVFIVVLESLGNLVNVGPFLVREIPFHQLEHLVQSHQRPDGLLGECRAIRHQHFVRLLDDRPIAAAVMPRGTGLKPNARHDADAKIDIVGRIRVEVDEVAFVDVGTAGRSLQPQGGVQLPLILGEEFLQRLLGFGTLCQNTFRGHFPNVGRSKVNTVVEAILKFGQINSFGINGSDHFIQLLLGRDDDPTRSDDLAGLQQVFADSAELFDGRPQVFDLVATAGHMLAHFVNDEDECLALPPSSPEFKRPFHDLADGDGSVSIPLGV